MKTIEGYVEKIVYRNAQNGYTVLCITADGEEITCVGDFVFVNEGEYLKLSGDYTAHNIYGEQFKVSEYETTQPTDEVAMVRYLASGAIKGIGEALANRIVAKFAKDTFHIIEDEPERLAEIKGISKNKAQEIYRQFYENKELRGGLLFLQQYGISMSLAVKIQQQYGAGLYEVIRTNPYKLAEDIRGVGFRTADEIAVRVGIATNSEYRVKAGILYTLQQAAANGHCFLPEEELTVVTAQLLLVDRNEIQEALNQAILERRLMIGGTEMRCVYTTMMYYMELNTARMLLDLNRSCVPDEGKLQNRLNRVEQSFSIYLDEIQRRAVEEAARHGLFVLTGGPGTGKTTTINAMIRFFQGEGMELLLAAPTGRAAKRMTEATGMEARTIHRLLEISRGPVEDEQDKRLGSSSELHFERNEQNPLEADVIIIDEMSMVDLPLMHALLKAIPVGTRLILVGDENQLPSVGPGNVLHDILASKLVPTVRLTKIFRQAGESHIVVNAHKINAGEMLDLENKNEDFFLLKRDIVNDVLGVMVALVRDKLPNHVKCQPYEIQVLTPMRKGELGVEKLNTVLQYYLNPASGKKQEKELHGILFREGDKVMQVKNNYQLTWEQKTEFGVVKEGGTGVFNGDIGIVREINTFAETLTVEFEEGRIAEYTFSDTEELELAYAVTIHKAQGSEYPAVIIPLLSGPRQLLHRNLLYTAVTRAKECVAMVGSAAAIEQMIANAQEQKRYTALTARIQEMVQQ